MVQDVAVLGNMTQHTFSANDHSGANQKVALGGCGHLQGVPCDVLEELLLGEICSVLRSADGHQRQPSPFANATRYLVELLDARISLLAPRIDEPLAWESGAAVCQSAYRLLEVVQGWQWHAQVAEAGNCATSPDLAAVREVLLIMLCDLKRLFKQGGSDEPVLPVVAPAAELESDDPWEGCEDIAAEDLFEWFSESLSAPGQETDDRILDRSPADVSGVGTMEDAKIKSRECSADSACLSSISTAASLGSARAVPHSATLSNVSTAASLSAVVRQASPVASFQGQALQCLSPRRQPLRPGLNRPHVSLASREVFSSVAASCPASPNLPRRQISLRSPPGVGGSPTTPRTTPIGTPVGSAQRSKVTPSTGAATVGSVRLPVSTPRPASRGRQRGAEFEPIRLISKLVTVDSATVESLGERPVSMTSAPRKDDLNDEWEEEFLRRLCIPT